METTETAWLAEFHDGDTPTYLAAENGWWGTTTDPNEAMRFARREDAQAASEVVRKTKKATPRQHSWAPMPEKPRPPFRADKLDKLEVKR